MRAKKVNEMIDPYTSGDVNMDLDVSYLNKIKKDAEDWIDKWQQEAEVQVEDKGKSLLFKGDLDFFYIKTLDIIPGEKIEVDGYLDISGTENLVQVPKEIKVNGDLYL
jgi:hypothetical protein